MSDHHQSSGASSPNLSITTDVGSPTPRASPASSDRTLIFPPLCESPTSTIYGAQVFYSRNRLSPDRWSIESFEAMLPTKTAAELYDRLMAEEPNSYHPTIPKPTFQPVYYDPEHPPVKYRRMCIISHENRIKKELANTGLTEKEIDLYARNASYYPGRVGSRYDSLRPGSFAMTSPRISCTSSEEEGSPRYLFKDLPAELRKRKTPIASPPAIIQPNAFMSPASLKRERDSLDQPPQTPDRKPIAEGWKTPTSSLVDPVDHLSPVFDRMSMHVTRRRRRKFERKSFNSPLASIHETPEHPAKLVPFIKKGPMDSAPEPDKVIGALLLKMPKKSDSAATSPTEPISSSLLSSKETITSRPSSGYKPSSPIILLVPKAVSTKYHTQLDKFSRDFNVEIVEGRFDSKKITHVIFDEDNTDEGNLKKIQAIGFQKYLVPINWIQDCLSNGPMLDPALYEVEVPPSRIARTSNPNLFAGFVFLCAKPFFKIEFEELKELLICNGASFIFDRADFFKYPNKTRVCIIGELEYYKDSKNKQQLRRKMKPWKCVKVHYQWIFEALTTYSLPPMIEYLFDTSLEEMRDAGVPEDLIN